MDLIFWRHAEAEDWTEGCDDMQRSLTARGEKQAKRMASWLDRQLPDGTRIICSPARRCNGLANTTKASWPFNGPRHWRRHRIGRLLFTMSGLRSVN